MSTQIEVLTVPMISTRFSLAEVTFQSSKYNSELNSYVFWPQVDFKGFENILKIIFKRDRACSRASNALNFVLVCQRSKISYLTSLVYFFQSNIVLCLDSSNDGIQNKIRNQKLPNLGKSQI